MTKKAPGLYDVILEISSNSDLTDREVFSLVRNSNSLGTKDEFEKNIVLALHRYHVMHGDKSYNVNNIENSVSRIENIVKEMYYKNT